MYLGRNSNLHGREKARRSCQLAAICLISGLLFFMLGALAFPFAGQAYGLSLDGFVKLPRTAAKWVTDMAVIGSLGAGLAALALTIIPKPRGRPTATDKAKKGDAGKSNKDPTAFIDGGAGDPNRYKLAFNDLMHGRIYLLSLKRNVGDSQSDSNEKLEGVSVDKARTAMELARTTFDAAVVPKPKPKPETTQRITRREERAGDQNRPWRNG